MFNNNEPTWQNYPVKRVIPNHITSKRKPGFQISEKKLTKEPSQISSFTPVSFGSPRKPVPLESRMNSSKLYDTTSDVTRYDDTINKTIDFSMEVDDDLPPSRSIYDLNDEILLNLDRPATHQELFLNKDPKNYSNVFNRQEVEPNPKDAPREDVNPLEHGESAILVFGYPESIANSVIQYFQEFGTILEDFEVNKNRLYKTINAKNDKIISCLSGNSWVKITYDNPALAIEALLQNGMVFNGSLLGVIPYTKDSVEKLQNRKLGEGEDIGSGFEYKTPNFKSQEPEEKDLGNSNFAKLQVKDGSKLFVSKEDPKSTIDTKNNNENLGVVGNIMKYVFGFNEL